MIRYISIIFLVAGIALAEEKPVDPMAWAPAAECPAFRELLKDGDYTARIKVEQVKLANLEAERAKAPARCLRVDSVNPNSQGERLNLEVGDYILKLDGKDVTDASMFNPMRTNTPQQMTILSIKRGTVTVEIQPGLLGTRFSTFIRDDPSEIGEGYNDPRWHADLKIASFLFNNGDPELVETAFFRAVATGMKMTSRMKALGAALAQKIGRYDEAMNFGWHALKEAPNDQAAQSNFYNAATCNYKLQAALDLARKTPSLKRNVDELERLVAAHDALTAEKRLRLPPSIEHESYFHDDIFLHSEPVPSMPKDDQIREAFAQDMLGSGQHHIALESGTFRHFRLKPAVENLMFSCRFKVKQTTPEFSNWLKCFAICAVPVDENGEAKFQTISDGVGLEFTPYEMPSIRVRRIDSVSMNIHLNKPGFYVADSEHTYRLFILNGQVEMQLDGQRIFYGPQVNRGEKYILDFGMVGTTIEITGARAWELLNETERKERVDKTINERFRDKETRLFRAASIGSMAYVKEILDLGADVNIPNSQNITPLHKAVSAARVEVADLLLARGAKLDVYSAAGMGDVKHLEELLAGGAKPVCPWTPLHCAAMMGKLETAKILLDKGADVNAVSSGFYGKRTPLMWAAMGNQKATIEFLVLRGASVNQTDDHGHTALWYAELNSAKESIAALKEKGAQTNVTNQPVKPPPPPTGDF